MAQNEPLPATPGYSTEAYADLMFGSPPWDHSVEDDEKAMPDEGVEAEAEEEAEAAG